MQPVNWRSRTIALSLSIVLSVLFALLCRSLVPRGGHNLPQGLVCLLGMYVGFFAFVFSSVRLVAHGVRWFRAGRPRSPF